MDAPPSTLAASGVAPAPEAAPTGLRTVGVEEELLLVDPRTGRVTPVAPVAMAADARTGAPALTPELQQEQVETATPPRTSMDDLLADLHALRARAQAAARSAGVLAVALATSPLPAHPSLSPGVRYRAISDRFGVTCAQQLTCGCHVHVVVGSAEEGVAVLDRIRCWLPLLSAVATNSPFADGLDTGYAGYRTQAWGRWPGTGPADVHGSAAAYQAHLRQLLDTGVLLDAGMYYPDARLSHRYPTVEIRVADVCLDPADAVLVAALARALVDTAAAQWRAGHPPLATATTVLRLAAWRASRSGVQDDLLHPVTARPVPAPLALEALLDHVGPALAGTGDVALVGRGIERVLSRGTGATWQRAVAAATGDLAEVVLRAAV